LRITSKYLKIQWAALSNPTAPTSIQAATFIGPAAAGQVFRGQYENGKTKTTYDC
jgi:hypothetical protein